MANRNEITDHGKEIGHRIAQCRDKIGENQKELAESIGVSREIIQHWEAGTRHVKADHIRALAQHFEVSADYLLGLFPEDTPDQTVKSVCLYTGLSASTVNYLHFRNPENDATISFYRKLFDLIVRIGVDYLDEIPEHMLEAAEAHVIAEQGRSDGKRQIENTLTQMTREGDSYRIRASDAEQYYLILAQEKISQCLANVLGELEDEAISHIRGKGTIDKSDFRWVTFDESEDFTPWFPDETPKKSAPGADTPGAGQKGSGPHLPSQDNTDGGL